MKIIFEILSPIPVSEVLTNAWIMKSGSNKVFLLLRGGGIRRCSLFGSKTKFSMKIRFEPVSDDDFEILRTIPLSEALTTARIMKSSSNKVFVLAREGGTRI